MIPGAVPDVGSFPPGFAPPGVDVRTGGGTSPPLTNGLKAGGGLKCLSSFRALPRNPWGANPAPVLITYMTELDGSTCCTWTESVAGLATHRMGPVVGGRTEPLQVYTAGAEVDVAPGPIGCEGGVSSGREPFALVCGSSRTGAFGSFPADMPAREDVGCTDRGMGSRLRSLSLLLSGDADGAGNAGPGCASAGTLAAHSNTKIAALDSESCPTCRKSNRNYQSRYYISMKLIQRWKMFGYVSYWCLPSFIFIMR